MKLSRINPFYKYLLVITAIVFIDQVVKIVIKLNMFQGEEIPLLGNLFKIHFIENPGAAFGMTFGDFIGGITPETAKLILTLFSVLAAIVILFLLKKVSHYPNKLPLCMAFILGGAVGNIIDRIFYGMWFSEINDYDGGFLHGRVVDMFYLDIYQGIVPEHIPIIGNMELFLWPIFNIADAAISIGIVTILIFQNSFFKPLEEKEAETTVPTNVNMEESI